MARVRFVVEGPQCAQIGKGLRENAFLENLEIDLRSEKGWFRETIFGTVTGKDGNVAIFMEALQRTVDDDNSYRLSRVK